MKMPMGKFIGQPVATMTTAYLCWLVTNDHIRFKRWQLVQEVLRVLRGRFDNLNDLMAELKVEAQPPAYWKTPEHIAKRKQEKAEKLAELEARRAEDRIQQQEERRVRFRQRQAERQPVIDGSLFVRKARENAERAALERQLLEARQRAGIVVADDVSDLL